jgi:predicted dehydrogenase
VLVGRDEDAASDAAERLGFADVATDWRDVVADVDVFYNLGPNSVHVDPTIAALEADTHVLCEKPLAPTIDGAERMAAAAADSDAVAAVGFNYRFVPAVQYAKRLVEAGELGEIRHARFRYLQDWLVDPDAPWTWRLDADAAGSGALGDLGAHSFDLARYLVGDVDAVSGFTQTFVDERVPESGGDARPVTVDDAFAAHAEFECGAMGTFEASRYATGRKNGHTFELDGTKGAVRFDVQRLNELEVKRPDGRGFETVLVTDEDDPYGDNWWPAGHVLGWEHTFVHENDEFLSAVAGDGDFRPAFADGLAVQKLLDAVDRSADDRAWVQV